MDAKHFTTIANTALDGVLFHLQGFLHMVEGDFHFRFDVNTAHAGAILYDVVGPLHIDIAFPLSENDEIDDYQFFVKARAEF